MSEATVHCYNCSATIVVARGKRQTVWIRRRGKMKQVVFCRLCARKREQALQADAIQDAAPPALPEAARPTLSITPEAGPTVVVVPQPRDEGDEGMAKKPKYKRRTCDACGKTWQPTGARGKCPHCNGQGKKRRPPKPATRAPKANGTTGGLRLAIEKIVDERLVGRDGNFSCEDIEAIVDGRIEAKLQELLK